MASVKAAEGIVELATDERLRLRVGERRAAGRALLAHQMPPGSALRPVGRPDPLEALAARIDDHRGLLWFDLDAPGSWLGSLLKPLKRLERRLLRSYLVQQDAFNDYALEFLRALAAERPEPRPTVCSVADTSLAETKGTGDVYALLLRQTPDPGPDLGTVALAPSGHGLEGLAAFFSGCRLVVGTGRGVEAVLRARAIRGGESVALTTCPHCQDAARAEGVRVIDGDLSEYCDAPDRMGADGLVLAHVVEEFEPAETGQLLRLIHDALPPGGRVAIVALNTPAYLDRVLNGNPLSKNLRLYPVELLSGLATACGFEVAGVSLP